MAFLLPNPNQATAGPSNATGNEAVANRPDVSVSGYRHGSLLGDRPASQDPFALPPMDRMLEYRQTETMGIGLFAKEHIPQGTRIVVEPPLLTMPTNSNNRPRYPGGRLRLAVYDPWWVDPVFAQDPKYDSDIDFFCRKIIDYYGLLDERITEMEKLCYDQDSALKHETLLTFRYVLVGRYMAATDLDTCRRIWGEDPPGPPGPNVQLNGLTPLEYQMSNLAVRYAKLYAIWKANHFELAEGTHADYGVFRIASRVNHSCTPNVSRSWVFIGGYDANRSVEHALNSPRAYMALTLNTINDIRCGDQIMMAYKDMTLYLPTARKLALSAYRIEACVCKLCTDPMISALQYRAWALFFGTLNYLDPNMPIHTKTVLWGTTVVAAKSAFDALTMAEELIHLLTHPAWDVRSQQLARAYEIAMAVCEKIAYWSEELGLSHQEGLAYWQKARMYSGRRIQVYIILEGTDGSNTRKADERNKELGNRRTRWIATKAGTAWAQIAQ